MAVMLFSIGVTGGLVWWQRRVARRTGNRVVRADSLHYIGDLIPNLGALIALWASATFGFGQIDSIVALAAALFLAAGALRIGKGAWDALMDRQASPDTMPASSASLPGFPTSVGSTISRHGRPAAASS